MLILENEPSACPLAARYAVSAATGQILSPVLVMKIAVVSN